MATSQSPDQVDRAAGLDGTLTETPQASSAPQSQSQQQAVPLVTAPTPITPTWGGSAQMLGLERADTPALQGEMGESSSTQTGTQLRPGSQTETHADNGQGATAESKGKARVATVEEASDSDEVEG